MVAKSEKCKKVYIGMDGSEARSAFEDATALEFRFANGSTHSRKPSDYPSNIQTCLAFFGISEKLGNAYAKSEDPDEAEEKFLSLDEQLKGGEFIAEREEAGPRPSLVADAVIRVATAKGLTFDPAAVRAKYIGKDGAAKRKEALTNAEIKAAYDAIRAENAAAKAAESAKLAAGATADIGAML